MEDVYAKTLGLNYPAVVTRYRREVRGRMAMRSLHHDGGHVQNMGYCPD